MVSDIANDGPRTAYDIGVETGSQAVLLASAARATTRATGSVLLLFFTVGLMLSNTLVAGLSSARFVSSSTKRNI